MSHTRLKILHGSPFDLHNATFYDGEIVCDNMTKRCYVYIDGDLKDITNAVDPTQNKRERGDALICKCCGAILQSIRCDYCGAYSWEGRDFFVQ